MVDILFPHLLADGLIDILFFVVGHLFICFWALNAQISDGRHQWVGEGDRSFSRDGWLTAIFVCCSKVLLQFLHCSGELVRCSWSKVKIVAFQVSALALEVSLGFGHRAWFILWFLTSVILGLGGLYLIPNSRYLQLITFRWAGWFVFDHYPTFSLSFLFLR